MPVHLTCPGCGTSFSRKPSRVRRAQTFCSHACYIATTFPTSRIILNDDGQTAQVSLCDRDLSIRGYALIDVVDAESVGRHRWYLNSQGYAARTEARKTIRMHRDLMGLEAGDRREPDHINRDRLDNRRSNLRVLSRAGNTQNQSPQYKTSRYRGVHFAKIVNKWQATVTVNGKLFRLGLFTDELQAAEVAREARARLLPYSTD